jgi:adenylyl- and sulfurtransferase ThiI
MEGKDIWDLDFGEIVIKKETVKRFVHMYRGNVRLALGRICTKEDFERKKKDVLNRSLP